MAEILGCWAATQWLLGINHSDPGLAAQCFEQDWVAVKELKISYHKGRYIYIYIHSK